MQRNVVSCTVTYVSMRAYTCMYLSTICMRVCVCVCLLACVWACVHACVRECVRVHVLGGWRMGIFQKTCASYAPCFQVCTCFTGMR